MRLLLLALIGLGLATNAQAYDVDLDFEESWSSTTIAPGNSTTYGDVTITNVPTTGSDATSSADYDFLFTLFSSMEITGNALWQQLPPYPISLSNSFNINFSSAPGGAVSEVSLHAIARSDIGMAPNYIDFLVTDSSSDTQVISFAPISTATLGHDYTLFHAIFDSMTLGSLDDVTSLYIYDFGGVDNTGPDGVQIAYDNLSYSYLGGGGSSNVFFTDHGDGNNGVTFEAISESGLDPGTTNRIISLSNDGTPAANVDFIETGSSGLIDVNSAPSSVPGSSAGAANLILDISEGSMTGGNEYAELFTLNNLDEAGDPDETHKHLIAVYQLATLLGGVTNTAINLYEVDISQTSAGLAADPDHPSPGDPLKAPALFNHLTDIAVDNPYYTIEDFSAGILDGVINPGESETVEVSFVGGGVPNGTYFTNLTVDYTSSATSVNGIPILAGGLVSGTLVVPISTTIIGQTAGSVTLPDGTDLTGFGVVGGGGIYSIEIAYGEAEGSVTVTFGPGDTFSLGSGFTPQGGTFEIEGLDGQLFIVVINYSGYADNPEEVYYRLISREMDGDDFVLAVDLNTPAGENDFYGGYTVSEYLTMLGGTPLLGDHGNDPDSNIVWAVLNHNSQFGFSSVPEPTTLALLTLLALPGLGRRCAA